MRYTKEITENKTSFKNHENSFQKQNNQSNTKLHKSNQSNFQNKSLLKKLSYHNRYKSFLNSNKRDSFESMVNKKIQIKRNNLGIRQKRNSLPLPKFQRPYAIYQSKVAKRRSAIYEDFNKQAQVHSKCLNLYTKSSLYLNQFPKPSINGKPGLNNGSLHLHNNDPNKKFDIFQQNYYNDFSQNSSNLYKKKLKQDNSQKKRSSFPYFIKTTIKPTQEIPENYSIPFISYSKQNTLNLPNLPNLGKRSFEKLNHPSAFIASHSSQLYDSFQPVRQNPEPPAMNCSHSFLKNYETYEGILINSENPFIKNQRINPHLPLQIEDKRRSGFRLEKPKPFNQSEALRRNQEIKLLQVLMDELKDIQKSINEEIAFRERMNAFVNKWNEILRQHQSGSE